MPILYYHTHFPRIVNIPELMKETLEKLVRAGSITLENDSEILLVDRNGLTESPLIMFNISAVNRTGELVSSVYLPRTEEKYFHQRNRELYKELAEKDELWEVGDVFQDNGEYDLEKDLAPKLSRVVRHYLDGNPGNNARLAIINAPENLIDSTKEIFMEIAGQYARLREIMI